MSGAGVWKRGSPDAIPSNEKRCSHIRWRKDPLFGIEDNKKGVVSVIGVVRSGYRGGNWNNNWNNARVSDRNNAANTNANRNNNNGGRCAKTPPIHIITNGKCEEINKRIFSNSIKGESLPLGLYGLKRQAL